MSAHAIRRAHLGLFVSIANAKDSHEARRFISLPSVRKNVDGIFIGAHFACTHGPNGCRFAVRQDDDAFRHHGIIVELPGAFTPSECAPLRQSIDRFQAQLRVEALALTFGAHTDGRELALELEQKYARRLPRGPHLLYRLHGSNIPSQYLSFHDEDHRLAVDIPSGVDTDPSDSSDQLLFNEAVARVPGTRRVLTLDGLLMHKSEALIKSILDDAREQVDRAPARF